MKIVKYIAIAFVVSIIVWSVGYVATRQEVQPTPNTNYKEQPVLGSFTPAGGLTYRLKSSIGTTNTSLVLSSFKNRTDIPLTMALLNTDIGYATLDPQTTNSEFISFTGITQNADGTATITGITRGLADIYPFTASTTMRNTHAGQSIFILSDSPQLFAEYPVKRNTENITGGWGFAVAPYDYGTSTSTLQFATRAYANSLAVQGAATSTTNASGIGLLATGAQAAAGTYTLTSPYFLSTLISTSTFFSGYNNQVIVTKTNDSLANTIDPNFLPRSSAITWGSTASTTFNSPIQLYNQAYIAASGTKPVYFNNIAYTYPSTLGASSTVLKFDGVSALTNSRLDWDLISEGDLSGAVFGTSTIAVPRKEYMITFVWSGSGSTLNPTIQFNGLSAANYGSRFLEGTIDTGYSNQNTGMYLASATATPITFFVRVNNTSGQVKTVTWDGTALPGGTSIAPMRISGAGVWNNTAQISSITFINLGTFPAGSSYRIYGSKD